jgi:hypothetical protein
MSRTWEPPTPLLPPAHSLRGLVHEVSHKKAALFHVRRGLKQKKTQGKTIIDTGFQMRWGGWNHGGDGCRPGFVL